jgi:hypothetical protein
MRLLWKTKDGCDIIIPRSKCYLLLKVNYALGKKRGIRSHRDTWFTGILLALSLELAKCHCVPLEGLASVCHAHHPENHHLADRARHLFWPVKQPIHLEHSIHC